MTAPTISRDASGRLAVELFDIPMEMYPSLCNEIAFAFSLSHNGELVTNGADVAFMNFNSDMGTVEMSWDHWSGFVVTAKLRESEPLIQRISEWFMDRKTEANK